MVLTTDMASAAAAAAMSGPWRLMVVDDEANQLEAVSEILRSKGFEVLPFSSPLEALAYLQNPGNERVDLLLSDLNMPGMDGIELVRQGQQAQPDMVSLMMTGQGTVKAAVAAMKLGAVDFILKPFRISELLPVIYRALEMRRLRKENKALKDQEAARLRELEEANRIIEAANKELDAFASRVAHDVRTPLSQMCSIAGLLEDILGPHLDEKAKQYFRYMKMAGDQGSAITTGLLAFARLREQPLEQERVSLKALVQRFRDDAEHSPDNAAYLNVSWHVGRMLDVKGDPLLLQQVVTNLLSNAVKYSSKARAPVVLVYCEETVEGQVSLTVSDNGAGFPAEKASKLFLPFQRLHSASDYPGHGFGLASVKRIVERHGGSVTAEGREGEGAAFTVRLPRYTDTKPASG
jgi:signal transduction histidine kinase